MVERIVVETMMCMNHFDNWKTQARASCKFLNENATDEEFDRFADNLHRLETIVTGLSVWEWKTISLQDSSENLRTITEL